MGFRIGFGMTSPLTVNFKYTRLLNFMKPLLTSILWHYLITKYGRQFSNREQLLRWQNNQVIKLLKKTLPKSQFYRHHYQGLDIKNWQQFPIINKALMMANFDNLNTVGIRKKEAFGLANEAEKTRDFSPTIKGYTIGLSSGTSGNRGLFLVSAAEQKKWAGTILAKALPQPILIPQKIAFFLRANSNLYETVQRQRIQLEYFSLFSSLEDHIQRLNELQPTILVAPPSMLRFLAEAKLNNELKILPIKIISVAEVLEPLDKQYIHHAFGQIVHQIYQCTEGFLGSTCRYGTLHLNEDIIVIQKEYIDQNSGRFVPIITDFNRLTQPIIRYRLDDVLVERQSPCPCGSIFTGLESIEGRQDDIFCLPNQSEEKLIPLFPDFIRRAIIMASETIEEYRVVQKSLDSIEVSLKLSTDASQVVQSLVTQSLQDLFRRYHCRIPEISYQEYGLRQEPDQKLRRIQRDWF